MSTPEYFTLAETYAGGVRSLFSAPATETVPTDRGTESAPVAQLADKAEELLPISGELITAASSRLGDADIAVRTDAEVKLLAKAATDLEIAMLLFDAAEQEGGGARVASTDRASMGGAQRVEDNLSALLSPPSASTPAATDRSGTQAAEGVEEARANALTQITDAIDLITRQAAKSSQAALGGLLGVGLSQVVGAVGAAGQGLANVLGVGETVSRWYGLVKDYAVKAYETVMALLGSASQAVSQKVVEWVNKLTGKWKDELKGGKLLSQWLEQLYETEATKKHLGELAAKSTAGPEKYTTVAEEADRLRQAYEKQMKWADKVLSWMPTLSGIATIALPHGTFLVTMLYVALGGYVIVAGADYVDAPHVSFLSRVPGVRDVAESNLAGA